MRTSRALDLDTTPFLAALDRGEPLEPVLAGLVRAVEAQADEMIGSILLLEGNRLRHGAAPDLPASYNAAIDGIEIGPNVGSCGTAAYCGHAIFVVDIASDPLWKDFKDVALQHGLRSCWSQPILALDGTVLGTFALYYRKERAPSSEERAAIAAAADAARLILERAAARRLERETGLPPLVVAGASP